MYPEKFIETILCAPLLQLFVVIVTTPPSALACTSTSEYYYHLRRKNAATKSVQKSVKLSNNVQQKNDQIFVFDDIMPLQSNLHFA